jgi:hypothetical protein
MIKTILSAMILAAGLAVTASAAEVFVRIAPPRVIVERRGPPPGSGYVYQPGYHNWDAEHNQHVWVGGRWEQPPRRNARWEQHRWVKRNGGYVLVEGHWR